MFCLGIESGMPLDLQLSLGFHVSYAVGEHIAVPGKNDDSRLVTRCRARRCRARQRCSARPWRPDVVLALGDQMSCSPLAARCRARPWRPDVVLAVADVVRLRETSLSDSFSVAVVSVMLLLAAVIDRFAIDSGDRLATHV